MEAKIVKNTLLLQSVQAIGRDSIAMVDCLDYEAYRKLPEVIEYQGKMLGKTGWNSDSGYACYKTGVALAKVLV